MKFWKTGKKMDRHGKLGMAYSHIVLMSFFEEKTCFVSCALRTMSKYFWYVLIRFDIFINVVDPYTVMKHGKDANRPFFTHMSRTMAPGCWLKMRLSHGPHCQKVEKATWASSRLMQPPRWFPRLMAVKITLTVLGFNHILPLDFDGFPFFLTRTSSNMLKGHW